MHLVKLVAPAVLTAGLLAGGGAAAAPADPGAGAVLSTPSAAVAEAVQPAGWKIRRHDGRRGHVQRGHRFKRDRLHRGHRKGKVLYGKRRHKPFFGRHRHFKFRRPWFGYRKHYRHRHRYGHRSGYRAYYGYRLPYLLFRLRLD